MFGIDFLSKLWTENKEKSNWKHETIWTMLALESHNEPIQCGMTKSCCYIMGHCSRLEGSPPCILHQKIAHVLIVRIYFLLPIKSICLPKMLSSNEIQSTHLLIIRYIFTFEQIPFSLICLHWVTGRIINCKMM